MNQKRWEKLLPGCFAGQEAPFGIHPNDEVRAIKMLYLAFCQGAKMSDIKRESRKHLKSQGVNEAGIKFQLQLIDKFKPNPIKAKIHKTKAWLITWEGAEANNKAQFQRIVNIFDSRISSARVKDFLENHYIATYYNNFEKATFASNRKRNPYPAVNGEINGISWHGQFTCGHNPFLFARIVKNLVIVLNEKNHETVNWEELPKPVVPKI